MNHMVPAKVQGLFFSGLSLAFKVNLSSPGFSGQWPEPQPASFRHDIPIRVSVDKPPLVPAVIGFMQKTLMPSLCPSECQILDGSGREKNTKSEGKSLSFYYPPRLHFHASSFPLFTFPLGVKF